jgi:ATP-dependent Clp protease ATP-binding subunit ClpC
VSSRLGGRARAVCDIALREALNLGHNYIQPEHLLLALISQEDSVTVRALIKVNVHPAELRRAVLMVLGDRLRQETS